jgi:tRNA pseudouridine synthase 10
MNEGENMDRVGEIIETAAAILRSGPICDECLGRAFAKLGHGFSNGERGQSLRTILSMIGVSRRTGTCWVCDGLFSRIEDFSTRAVAAAEGVEYESYLFGVKLTARLQQMELFFREKFPTGLAEPLKHAFNREMGKAFEARVGHGTLDLTHPHLSFIINLERDRIELHVLSLYIYGRYRKLVRGIPQTRWPCRLCQGKGCEACGFTGKQYPESVEELVAAPFLTAARAEKAHLHGAGREDIDARMLGTGRPFVLEVLSPLCRTLDLSSLQEAVNSGSSGKVEVSGLYFVSRETVALVKETHAEKTYRARVSFESEVAQDDLARALASLVGMIHQRTPVRVSHRRADLVRERRLLNADGTLLSPHEADLILRGEGGLYIKELVSGDEGRTIPSLSERLAITSRVAELDVIDVTADSFPDS